jgi:hypothetical protein
MKIFLMDDYRSKPEDGGLPKLSGVNFAVGSRFPRKEYGKP